MEPHCGLDLHFSDNATPVFSPGFSVHGVAELDTTERLIHTHTQTHTDTHTQTHIERYTHRHTDTHRYTHTHFIILIYFC